MSCYVFITGGVVSSLGKGIAAASLGAILKARGLKVSMTKLDPYINIDPGTMNPFEHGEVYVTDDGTETDLDLGHYERFVQSNPNCSNNYTTGKIYMNVINRERRGDYLGATVQVIPHITDEIKRCIQSGAQDADIALIEIGGTVGDIESQPFLEAIRQLRMDLGSQRTFFIHLTLVPTIHSIGEIKTKPTQHSVKELRSIGIQPDCLLCRTSKPIPDSERKKISLFTNVSEQAIISAVDVDNIYKIPRLLHQQALDKIVVNQFNMSLPEADLSAWNNVVKSMQSPKHEINIAMVGKYTKHGDSYISLSEALKHAGIQTNTKVNIHYIDAEHITKQCSTPLTDDKFKQAISTIASGTIDAILIPGGFGARGIEGKLMVIRYARENNIPFLGICLGMQLAVIDIARHLAQLDGADSTEFNQQTPHPVIGLITEWQDQNGNIKLRDHSNLGGTMRLGGQECTLTNDSLVKSLYQQDVISERHRHRYEMNNHYRDKLEVVGLKISGTSTDGQLVEIIELELHPWFVACQFHPEFKSTPQTGHPLFTGFIQAANGQ